MLVLLFPVICDWIFFISRDLWRGGGGGGGAPAGGGARAGGGGGGGAGGPGVERGFGLWLGGLCVDCMIIDNL